MTSSLFYSSLPPKLRKVGDSSVYCAIFRGMRYALRAPRSPLLVLVYKHPNSVRPCILASHRVTRFALHALQAKALLARISGYHAKSSIKGLFISEYYLLGEYYCQCLTIYWALARGTRALRLKIYKIISYIQVLIPLC